jgi:hypothetical protein
VHSTLPVTFEMKSHIISNHYSYFFQHMLHTFKNSPTHKQNFMEKCAFHVNTQNYRIKNHVFYSYLSDFKRYRLTLPFRPPKILDLLQKISCLYLLPFLRNREKPRQRTTITPHIGFLHFSRRCFKISGRYFCKNQKFQSNVKK